MSLSASAEHTQRWPHGTKASVALAVMHTTQRFSSDSARAAPGAACASAAMESAAAGVMEGCCQPADLSAEGEAAAWRRAARS